MNENQTSNKDSYEELAYPGVVVPLMHPASLATIAKFHRVNAAAPEKCRVLELGCANGINLNWQAFNLPESQFVGVDSGKVHIDTAKKGMADLELQNISFFEMDLLEISEKTFGKFDYIIAHGLFSWVPDFVREKILNLYDELLNPNGVGFLSYNVYPGFYFRQIIRDAMFFHGQRFATPAEKVEQGVNFIKFLAKHNADDPIYQEILKYELKWLWKRPAGNIYHDELSEFNQPFYFKEFISEAEKHNLQFLSEAEYISPHLNNVSEEVVQVFESMSDIIEYEQYRDFLHCRKFRQTLLCKKDVVPEREKDPAKVREFYISSVLTPTSETIDLNPDSVKEFVSKKDDKINIGHVLTKVVLMCLVDIGAHPIKFSDLIERANELLQTQGFIYEDLEKEVEITANYLLQLNSPYAIKFHLAESKALDYVSEKPIASKFARWQAAQFGFANNFYGFNMNLPDNFTRSLLNFLDGTRTREDLIAELTKVVHADENMTDKEEFLAKIPENVDQNLFVLAKMGFLVG
jgi:methyltransferase-like protein/SAM-dependent methyltransferase